MMNPIAVNSTAFPRFYMKGMDRRMKNNTTSVIGLPRIAPPHTHPLPLSGSLSYSAHTSFPFIIKTSLQVLVSDVRSNLSLSMHPREMETTRGPTLK